MGGPTWEELRGWRSRGRAGGRNNSDLTFVPPRTSPGGFSLLKALGPLRQPSPGSLPFVPGITHQACPLHSAPLCASVPSSFSLLAPTLHPHVKSCLFARAHLIPRGHPFLTVLPKQLVFCLPGFSGSHQHHRLECLYGMCVCVGVWVCPLTRLVPSVTGRYFKSPFLGKKKGPFPRLLGCPVVKTPLS